MNRPPVEAPSRVLDEPVGERPEQRGSRAEADRAGRVVDRKGILRARGVRLQPAEVPQACEVRPIEAPQEILERVQHRRCVRLHRDAILGPKVSKDRAVIRVTIDADDAW